MESEYNKLTPLLDQISKDLLVKLNTTKFLDTVKPFPEALREIYFIDSLKPILIFENNDKKGALVDGLLYRRNKFFAYHILLEISFTDKNKYKIHNFDIVSFHAYEDTNMSFGKYLNSDNTVCYVDLNDETNKLCPMKNTLTFKQFKKELAETVSSKVEEIYSRYDAYRKRPDDLRDILQAGGKDARIKATKT